MRHRILSVITGVMALALLSSTLVTVVAPSAHVSAAPAAQCYVYSSGSTSQFTKQPCSQLNGGDAASYNFQSGKCYTVQGPGPEYSNIQETDCSKPSVTPAAQCYIYTSDNITTLSQTPCSQVQGGDASTYNFQDGKCYTVQQSGSNYSNIQETSCTSPRVAPTGDPSQQCENVGFSLSWIMCKIIDGLANAVDGIYTGLIEPMLKTPSLDPSSASGKHIYQAWSTFRVYGDIFLVIALLVVVFGQSIGGGLVDAYTAKKVLPRLLAAAILINISYFVVTLAVDISNIVGYGLGNLILTPFGLSQPGGTVFDLSSMNGSAQAGATTIGIGGGALAAIVGASFVAGAGSVTAALGAAFSLLWAFVLLPALLIFLSVMVTLIIRLGLIYILVLFSPVAFALYTLPNTEQYFKRWWKILYETLLVFPIITVFFAISKVMAQSTIWATGSSGVKGGFAYILSLLILVVPLVFIPFAFRIAGGIIGKVHEATEGMREKAKQSGFMQRTKENAAKRGQANMVGGRARMVTGLGRTGLGRGLQNNRLTGGVTRRAIERADQRSRTLSQDMQKDPRAMAIKDDDNALRAQTYRNAAEARRDMLADGINEAEVNRAIAAVQAANGFGRAQAINAAQRMVDTGTAVRDIEDMSNIIARASDGNASTIAGIAGYANSVTKSVGRHDLSPGFATLNKLSSMRAKATVDPATGKMVSTIDPDTGKEITKAQFDDRVHTASREAWNSVDISTAVRSKSREIQTFANHFADVMNDPNATDAHRRDAAVALSELQAALPSATGDNQRYINDALQRVGYNFEVGTPVERQMAERANAVAGRDIINAEEINQRARKYGNTPYDQRGGPQDGGGGAPAGGGEG